MKHTLPTLAILLCGTASVLATDRFYCDIEGRSPNWRYLAEAKSLDNKNNDGYRKAFQSNFTVTFSDTQSERGFLWFWKKKTLWTWEQKQGEDGFPLEGSPVELIPTDNGQLIMKDAWDSYHVFETNGVKHVVFDMYNLIPKEEWDQFTSWTTAGTFWEKYSQQKFITIENKTYFYIRLYWGRILIIDVEGAKCETDVKITEMVESCVVEETRRLIKEFNGKYNEKCKSCGGYHVRKDLTAAVFVIKKHNIEEGLKLLNDVVERSGDGHHGDLTFYLDKISSEGDSND